MKPWSLLLLVGVSITVFAASVTGKAADISDSSASSEEAADYNREGAELAFDAAPSAPSPITDLNGRPVPTLTATKTLGRDGPVLLDDVNFVNHLGHFDREKIPDRVVHAKGAGAHGFFEVTHDITNYTKAAVFSSIGKRTPVFVRFSSTQFESGSADTIRDGRGFATKFYTEEGNWDLVGNQLLVFPIRDPILFPSLIRSRRRNPASGLRDGTAWWDFVSLRPETTHHTLQLLSDLGTTFSWRHMDGGGVHTFTLVNAEGKPVYCKFHWRTNQGLRNLTAEEADKLMGTNADYYREDLFKAIERGDYPSWNLSIQVMTFEEAAKYPWNPFDVTKIWLEKDYPLMPVGRMVLNRNPQDFFTETEMAAFAPGNLVPGIETSPDPMFHGRTFSYPDTQRHRLGPNFQQLPINRPKTAVNSYDRDGQCAFDNNAGRPNYFPNSFDDSFVSPSAAETVRDVPVTHIMREDTKDDDNYSQAKIFLDSLSATDREHMARNIASAIATIDAGVQQRVVEVMGKVDVTLATEINTYIKELTK